MFVSTVMKCKPKVDAPKMSQDEIAGLVCENWSFTHRLMLRDLLAVL